MGGKEILLVIVMGADLDGKAMVGWAPHQVAPSLVFMTWGLRGAWHASEPARRLAAWREHVNHKIGGIQK